jgi:hypothetical protein
MPLKPIAIPSWQNIWRKTPQQIQKTFTSSPHINMPLVVPGITNKDDGASKTEDWANKLVGKKLGSSSDATVCPIPWVTVILKEYR